MSKKPRGQIKSASTSFSLEKKTVTFNCPVRGKVSQEVEVKVYKSEPIPEDRQVDPDVAELLSGELQELEEAGFHEEPLN